ncbi:hypothetical protein CSB37_04190 [bacterium DOLZORAL124_38_8]|nr:MAG: hypothetical protein CSB37_04190 [bacterium DOLZORAL124_38_8]
MNFQPKKLLYLIAPAVAFYIVPLLIRDTGLGMLVLLLIIPIIIFINSIVFGVKNRWHWEYPVVIGLCFVSTIPIFYNQSASVYGLIYGILAALGALLGGLLRPNHNSYKITNSWKIVITILVSIFSIIAILFVINLFSINAFMNNNTTINTTHNIPKE